MLDRNAEPLFFYPTNFEFQLSKIKKTILDNEIELYYLIDNNIQVIQLDFVFDAGSIFENKKQVAALTNQLLKSGTKTKTAEEIDEFLEYYGIDFSRNCGIESVNISIKMLSKHIEKIFPLLSEIFTECTFPETEIELLKKKNIQSLNLNFKKPEYVANNKINELLFGSTHAYGTPITIDDIEDVNKKDIELFYKKFYSEGNCKMFVSGNLTNNFIELCNQYLGQIPFQKNFIARNFTITPKNFYSNIDIKLNDQAVQTSLRIGKICLNNRHPDLLKCRILNIALGGYFGSRLMKTVREKKGFTYGIYSFIQNNKQDCAWIISSETGLNIKEKAIQAIINEMKKLQKTPIGIVELNQIKNFYLGLILGDIEGSLSIMNIWKNLILNQFDENYFYQNIYTIKNIHADELQSLAIKYLDPKEFLYLSVN